MGIIALGISDCGVQAFVRGTKILPFSHRDSGSGSTGKSSIVSTTLSMSVPQTSSRTTPHADGGQRSRPGILIVGIGGGNGVTALAGIIANKAKIVWEGPTGRMSPNYLGCITQLPSKGGSGGYREKYPLADANDAAIGGWDIRSTPLGAALYNARILDFDLVRQVQKEMDTMNILPGVWDSDFIGESQHASATNVVGDGQTQQSRLELLRKDIREFRESQGVTGHVTVIWSASVERPSERDFKESCEVPVGIEQDRCYSCDVP